MNRFKPLTANTRIQTREPTVCTCERPTKVIFCHKCGKSFNGRRRIECGLHPKVIYLMDVEACIHCSSHNLKEF